MKAWQGKHGPMIIAEIGGNHEGDFAYAQELTRLAIDTDVDYVKFQVYSSEALVNPREDPVYAERFAKFALTQEQYLTLADQCRDAGVGFMASVWGESFLSWLDDRMDFYKVGSGDMTAWPLLRRFAQIGKPLLLSTGMATLDEVVETVRFIQSVDSRYCDGANLGLMQCTASYPCDDADANLSTMAALRAATGLPVGYSDHTRGVDALRYAVAMGAPMLEFHFTDQREGKEFWDHWCSLEPDEVRALVAAVRDIERFSGDGVKRPLESEAKRRVFMRRAVFPARDLPAGHVVTAEDLTCVRPNHGLDARHFDDVVGRTVARDLTEFEVLDWDAFEGPAPSTLYR